MTEETVINKIKAPWIKVLNKDILNEPVPFTTANAYKIETVQARDDKGQFIADNPDTEDIDESKTTAQVKKTWREFTDCHDFGDVDFIQVTGGKITTCYNNSLYPLTDEMYAQYLEVGDPATNADFKVARDFYNNIETEI